MQLPIMWAKLHVRCCTRLTRFISQTRYLRFSQELPQKVTFIRYMSSKSEDSVDTEQKGKPDETSSANLSSRQRLSLIFAEYGVTAVVFHTAISLTSLGLCYGAVSSGLDVPSFLIKIGLSESASQSMAAKGASTFVISYACHKVFMPVRIFLTVTCTPMIVHRLRRLGLIK